ncbi:arginine-hydroxylase NDUFAF5, mitochondrial [Ischnura elegans]|uniref:arginine-hydroxylase NDUFAF5, mitochondrial n=1 Tax=Ischnura elegans TaxID=197161 RepID=UPI001ED87F79|nr:arginine-hydroxylase NDUFAF5, mitochondrial [Ischnura elegans]
MGTISNVKLLGRTLISNRKWLLSNESGASCVRGLKSSVVSLQEGFSSMKIFDRKSKLLQRERAAIVSDVHLYDYIKEEIGFRLADRVKDVKRTFNKAIDFGCGRGHVTKNILPESVKELTCTEMSPRWLEQVCYTSGLNVKKVVMDEECPTFEENSYDLVMSNLSLHWVNDLPGTFDRIKSCLVNDGVFMASVFGGETLYELRSSLQLADLERKGGVAPHISPFVDVRDLGGLLNRAGFTMLTVDTDEMVISYPSMFELMWDLKGMGESNAALNRPLHLGRDVAFAAASIYKTLYGNDDGSIPATFQIFYFIGWKPDASQPKPLRRGSGQISLKDLHRIDEIAKERAEIQLDGDERTK